MKKLLLILLCVPLIGFGQLTMIPDANFEQELINLGYDTGTPNGSVPTANIDTVTGLEVDDLNISDLTGIEDFSALTELFCGENQLTSLDVSNNTALTELECWDNQLTSLDVSGATALTILNCSGNQLTSLDVSSNTALIALFCSDNQLTSLDISGAKALTNLSCDYNQLATLDISNNTSLLGLICEYNELTLLNVSQNAALSNLACGGNKLVSLDVSQNTDLHNLACGGNKLVNLDVSHNTALDWLECLSNQLTSLDVSQNIGLSTINCGDNQLTSLDVSKNTALNYLYVNSNQLTSLNLKNGNNQNLWIYAINNFNLNCIEVDDTSWANTFLSTHIDSTASFSTNCGNVSNGSQSVWAPPGATWHYNYVHFATSGYVEIKYVGDSIISGITSKVLRKTMNYYDATTNTSGTYIMGEEYTYLSNDTVFRYLDGKYHMLYDFSAGEGDYWEITASPNNLPCDSLAVMNIDSVNTTTINSFTLKSITASDSIDPSIGGPSGYMGWSKVIERIGPLGYMFPELACVMDANEGGGLICYYDSTFGLYETGLAQNCGVVGIEEYNDKILGFSSFPNPFADQLTLEFNDHSNYEIKVFDLVGKELLVLNVLGSSHVLSTSHLPAGIYIIQVRSEDRTGIQKLIKK